MLTQKMNRLLFLILAGSLVMLFAFQGCGTKQEIGSSGDAASKVYVPPGSYDEFYCFMSGGYSGNVTVYGLPSGRLIKTIPVFSLFPENGYGFSEETKDMLLTSYGHIPWDDSHHPKLSVTNGKADGRWLLLTETIPVVSPELISLLLKPMKLLRFLIQRVTTLLPF